MRKTIMATAYAVLLMAFSGQKAFSQSLIDLGVGASTMDRFFTNVAWRYQMNDGLRFGVEMQLSSPQYRFIEAKPFDGGYATTLHLPLSLRITEQGRIRLDGYLRPGVRFQGVVDPDGNDMRDSILNSVAVLFEAGFLVHVRLSDRLNLSSGVILPSGFEIVPTSLFEYLGTPNVAGGLSYAASGKTTVFLKGITGPAFGADGDTYKYIWSVQGGIRLALGKDAGDASLWMEPSF